MGTQPAHVASPPADPWSAFLAAATAAPETDIPLADYARAHQPGFVLPWHLALLIDRLEAVERGEVRRLMVCMPPRHGKSTLTSKLFPAWYLGRHPERQVLFATYAAELAADFGRKVRNLVQSEEHRTMFPRCVISQDSSSVQRFDTTRDGAFYAVGRGGSITGRGADVILIDDPLRDREEAESAAIRRGLHAWFSDVVYTRLQPKGAIVLINTRWHTDDLTGYLLREYPDEGWQELTLPAIAERDEPWRREGEALWPARFPLEELRKIQRVLLSSFAALYQQRPVAREGAIFKRAWWGRYDLTPAEFRRVVQVWDTAFKAEQRNDPSACTTWGETESAIYLLHAWRGRVEFPELVTQASRLFAAWRPNVVLVEDKASGQSLIQSLKRSTLLPVLAVKVDSDKVSRAHAVTPTVEAGKVLLPVEADWLPDYLEELSTFPAAPHDDYVDTTTMALQHMAGRMRSDGDARQIARPHRGLRGV